MRDCWHFITKEGFIFTTRGFNHPSGFIIAIGLYYPDIGGDRAYLGTNYSKDVDEYGDKWVGKCKPEYIRRDDKGNRILVPLGDIKKYFDPFSVSDEKRDLIKKTRWGNLITTLESFIPKEDIGFIGSYLIGFQTQNSDIDVVIRGIKNLKKIKDNFNLILEKLGATQDLDEHMKRISLEKYNRLYKGKNDFARMIKNRWPTIRTKDYTTKLRFVPRPDEIVFPKINNKIKEIKLSGEVIEDIGTNFMPRFFKIKNKDGEYSILTYFWDYTYCVKNGDYVNVVGSLFEDNLVMVNNKDEHGITFK